MSDARLVRLENSVVNFTKEFNDLKSVLVKHLEESKIDRSDKLLSASEAMSKLGISNDSTWAKIKQDPTFPKTKLSEGGYTKYSDKAIDEWIAKVQIFKSFG